MRGYYKTDKNPYKVNQNTKQFREWQSEFGAMTNPQLVRKVWFCMRMMENAMRESVSEDPWIDGPEESERSLDFWLKQRRHVLWLLWERGIEQAWDDYEHEE
jgi:hypothetical protein